MRQNKKSRESPSKPHPWRSAVVFVVEQGLAFARGDAVSVKTLSKAKFREKLPDTSDVFFLRQFGPSSPDAQITARFSLADDMFKRRSTFSVHVGGLFDSDFQEVLTGALTKYSFIEKDSSNLYACLFADGNIDMEVSVHFRDESAAVRFQKP